jgi:AcrR family transcriptional regulator
VSPRTPDPRIRRELVDAAARVLAEGGPDALSTRRLASEVGTSTMAVYTYFSGMAELRHAVRKEGFDRLAAHLDEVTDTDDPVADLSSLGAAYFLNALENPHLYRFMFMERPIDDDPEVGMSTFESLVAGVQRVVDSGRFSKAEAWGLATQLWAASHGVVTLHLAGLLELEDALRAFSDIAFNLFVVFGDEPEAARRSISAARTGLAAPVFG